MSPGVGWYGIFRYGQTNRNSTGCPNYSAARAGGDVPANFSVPGGQHQFAWTENGPWKLFGCASEDEEEASINGVRSGEGAWHFFMYNLEADRAERHDLWASERPRALAMFGRFQLWQASVIRSMGDDEMGCLSRLEV